MKTKKLIEEIKNLGYTVEEMEDRIEVRFISYPLKNKLICVVYKNQEFFVSTNYAGMMNLDYIERLDLINIILKYMTTPIKCRLEDKKYILIHDYITNNNGMELMLCKNKFGAGYRLKHLLEDNEQYQVQFTADEIKNLKIELGSRLMDYEIVEVENA